MPVRGRGIPTAPIRVSVPFLIVAWADMWYERPDFPIRLPLQDQGPVLLSFSIVPSDLREMFPVAITTSCQDGVYAARCSIPQLDRFVERVAEELACHFPEPATLIDDAEVISVTTQAELSY